MALGALIIKEKLGISDRETVEQIRENPYLQSRTIKQSIEDRIVSLSQPHIRPI
jgi:hypothetical protein